MHVVDALHVVILKTFVKHVKTISLPRKISNKSASFSELGKRG